MFDDLYSSHRTKVRKLEATPCIGLVLKVIHLHILLYRHNNFMIMVDLIY